MGNSIFDDDDGFSLSGGIEGEEPKPQVKRTPAAPAPIKPVGTQRPTAPSAEARRTPPARPQGTSNPGVTATNAATSQNAPLRRRSNSGLPKNPAERTLPPVNKLTSNPGIPTGLPVAPTQQKPASSLPPIVSMPQKRSEQKKNPLPTLPVTPTPVFHEQVTPEEPVAVEPESVSYAEAAEENIHGSYHPPVIEENDEEEEELREAERRAEERRLRRQRALEQEREEERREEEERLLRAKRAKERAAELEAEEAETPVNNAKGDKGKTAVRKGNKRTPKPKPEKGTGKFSGERRKILILRLIALSVLVVFVFAGLKATFLPAKGPTAKQVIATVKDGIGMTNFPTGNGEGFVLAFSKIYLTVPKDGGGERAKALEPYVPPNVITEQQYSSVPSAADAQVVTGGPYISGVISKDDKNAVYTVTAQINNGTWIYIDVPVFYDNNTKAFAVSGTPAFVPAPKQAKVDPQTKPWNDEDQEAVKIFTPAAKLFFAAWAKSNTQEMLPYQTADADTATKTGLDNTVKFDSLTRVSIQPADGLADPNTRKARVTVRWENALVPKTYYSQTYDLVLVKVPDADQWRIKSIVGGITTDNS